MPTPVDTGAVLCNPFGYEAICSHRSLRRIAEVLAAAGIPSLRFDYDGTGDSAGDDRDPERLAAWVESTRDACRALRELTGVTRVCLVGVRLGALIATLASLGQDDVAGIVAIAPVVSGKAYLRELAVLQATLDLDPPPNGVTTESLLGEGAQEAVGFAITKETREALSRINLTKIDERIGVGSASALVLDRDDLPAADPWIAHLRKQGVATEAQRIPGYLEMMLDPHKAIVPRGILHAVTDWVGKRTTRRDGEPSGGLAPVRSQATFGDVVEELVFVDDAKLVFGVHSYPRTRERTGRALILLNAGAIHHVGPNRLHVALARSWAAAGHEVLRLDITGIGESATRPGLGENLVYGPRALEDIAAAIAFLRRGGATDVRPIGLCSGAFHAFRSAVTGQAVSGFVAINPLFYMKPPTENTDFPSYRVARETVRYQRAARDIEKWKKLLRGQVRVKAAAQTIVRHAAGRVIKRARDVSRSLDFPWEDDVGVDLERLAQRAIAAHFIFAQGDPGNQILHDYAGAVVSELQRKGALTIAILEGPDHTFTPLWSHSKLIELLDAAISSPSASR